MCIRDRLGALVSEAEPGAFSVEEGVRETTETLAVASLEGFDVGMSHAAIGPAGAALRYARHNCGGGLHNVHTLQRYAVDGFMVIDETTRRNLEILRPLRGSGRKGTLLGLVDRCATPMGSRRLRDQLAFPLLDPSEIGRRQDIIEHLVQDHALREDVRAELKAVADIERISARVTQGQAHARDLALLRRSLCAVPRLLDLLPPRTALRECLPEDTCTDVAEDLVQWLVDDPPQSLTEGGLIAGVFTRNSMVSCDCPSKE